LQLLRVLAFFASTLLPLELFGLNNKDMSVPTGSLKSNMAAGLRPAAKICCRYIVSAVDWQQNNG
jgi:hypothetical protein